MCSHFLMMKRTMMDDDDNYQLGDLTDIIRAGATAAAAGGGGTNSGSTSGGLSDHWQFPNNPIIYPPGEDFGDPFTQLGDPLMHGINPPVTEFYNQAGAVFSGGSGNVNNGLNDNEMKRANMFSRMLQISPGVKMAPPPCENGPPGAGGMLVCNDPNSSSSSSLKGCLVETTTPAAGLQISSPRITGIKRRKSQAKKVVCIPAPAPANSRPSGEVVPSDLWAWRKYGQKPIKGSPYPRGYYRCSSSKGCSARKQVERSRTDPNMLVITYTSEHNHPWPTQRNALAGSTRSQPSKTTTTNPKTSSPAPVTQKCKDDDQPVKAELLDIRLETEEDGEIYPSSNHQGFAVAGYKPPPPPENNYNPPSEDSFFADFGEIEAADSRLNFLFAQGGFSNRGDDDHPVDDGDDKSLDPFSFYDDYYRTGSTAGSRNHQDS